MNPIYNNTAFLNLHGKKTNLIWLQSKAHQAEGTNVGQEILGWQMAVGLWRLIKQSI